MKNESCQSALSEHKALEECVVRLDIINDEITCFEMMNQCHLAMKRNEKEVDHERQVCEQNELIDEHHKMGKVCNTWERNTIDFWLGIENWWTITMS